MVVGACLHSQVWLGCKLCWEVLIQQKYFISLAFPSLHGESRKSIDFMMLCSTQHPEILVDSPNKVIVGIGWSKSCTMIQCY